MTPGPDPAAIPQTMAPLFAMLTDMKGQDLHLAAGAPPSIRIDGDLVRLPMSLLTPGEIADLVQLLLTPAQRESFARERELDFAMADEGGRFRCNVYQQRGSVAFTARRILEHIPSAADLGLPTFLGDAALRKQGFILIVGPNGHGKSTTLAWMIEHINQHRRANIITIEDPIEFHFEHKLSNVNQREVGVDTRSFSEGLHRVVRQNPDVVVVGELRDYDSIATAVSAAQTGHLVLATIHSVNATATIDRLIEFYPSHEQSLARSQLAESLLLVLSQRLIKRAAGAGRVLAWEKLASSPRVKHAIREGRVASLRALMQSAHEDLVPMDKNIAELIARRVIAREEGLRFAENPSYIEDVVAALHAKRAVT